MEKQNVLVVDDDENIAASLRALCKRLDFNVTSAHTVAEAIANLESPKPTIIILDLSLPDGDGVEVLRELNAAGSQAAVILVSGFDKRVLATVRRLAVNFGLQVAGALSKPFSLDLLRASMDRAVALSRGISQEDLRTAIAEGQIRVVYQPKIDLRRPTFASAPAVEALVRWRHPHHGDIPPSRLLLLAEESGQVRSLAYTVFRSAFAQMRTWKDGGVLPKVAINLAPELVDDPQLPEKIATLAREHEIDLNAVIIEITETAAMQDTDVTMDVATRLRLQGIGLSIDDFGTGYSSLRQLYRIPFNELKIDISFVAEMGISEEARTLVKASIELAHNLGMSACAEGVEDHQVLSLLNEMGCDTVQGFFISPPVPAHGIDTLLLGWRNPFPRSNLTLAT